MSEPTKQLIAPDPFNDKRADVIFRTSDGVDFYIHKSLLILQSPFFETMFQLPQGRVPGENADEDVEGRPVILFQEKSEALHLMLSWSDPRCTPMIPSLYPILAAAGLAIKYDMRSVITRIQDTLMKETEMIASNPLAVYAFGVRHSIRTLAHQGAREFLRVDGTKILDSPPDLDHVPASALLTLYNYANECRRRLRVLILHKSDWEPSGMCWNGGQKTVCRDAECGVEWFTEYATALEKALQHDLLSVVVRSEGFASEFLARAETCTSRCRTRGTLCLQRWNEVFFREYDFSLLLASREFEAALFKGWVTVVVN